MFCLTSKNLLLSMKTIKEDIIPVNDYYIVVTKRACEKFGLKESRIKNRVLLHWENQEPAPDRPGKGHQQALFIDDEEISWTVILSDSPAPSGRGHCAFVVGGRRLTP